MKDQVTTFEAKGVTAMSLSDKESLDSTSFEKVKKGDYQLLFVSPEALFASLEWRRMLGGDVYRETLVAFAVDEDILGVIVFVVNFHIL